MKEQKKYAYSRTAFQFDVVVRGSLRYVFCRLECTGNVFYSDPKLESTVKLGYTRIQEY